MVAMITCIRGLGPEMIAGQGHLAQDGIFKWRTFTICEETLFKFEISINPAKLVYPTDLV